MKREQTDNRTDIAQISLENTKFIIILHTVYRESVGGIATRWGLDGPGIESQWGRDFPHPPRPALGPTHPPTQFVPGPSRG
jgi:hypothetical protein